MVIALVSAKGSPGVTTTALALAAVAGPAGLFVELDPAGGSVECWTGTTGEPGLVQVTNTLRRAATSDALTNHVVEVPAGVWSVLAPGSGTMADSTITAAGDGLVPACSQLDRVVVLDGGRWARSQPTANRIAGCTVGVIVCAPTVAGVDAARWLAEPLGSMLGTQVTLVLVGDRPYAPREVAAAVGVPVAGVIPWDRRGVGMLLNAGAGRVWSRSPLARSARSVLETLRVSSGETVGSDG